MRKKNRNRVPTSVAILQALIQGEAYGVEIETRLRSRTDGRIKLSNGALYETLWKLEEEGLLDSRETEGPPERGGRPRKYYCLTAEGMRIARDDQEVLRSLIGLGLPQGGTA